MKRSALWILLLCSFTAKAGLFEDDDARRQIKDLAAQIQILQKDALDLQSKTDGRIGQSESSQTRRLTEMFNQLEKLRQEIATLRGQQEVIQFNVDEATKRQKDLYLDLDTRLRALEQAKVESKAAAQANEQSRFDEAVEMVKAGKNKDGINALNKFAKDYPQSKHLASAAYWLGQAQLANKDLKGAKNSFSYVVSQAPEDATAPDALLGLATIAAQQNDRKTSRNYLVNIIEKYPQSAAAETAKKALTVSE